MNEADTLWDVVEEHLDEAAFLWTQWERALVAPNCTLKDVIRGPEERLLAHIDGLLVAGEPAVERLLIPALAGDEADKVFAAALALLDGTAADAFARVVARLDEAEPEVANAIARALALAHRKGVEQELLEATRSEHPARVAAALSALATRRVEVPELGSFLASRDVAVLEPALRAARVGGARFVGLIERAFASEVPAVRDAALETGLVLGMRSAWDTCQRLVAEKRPDAAFALLVLGIGGDLGDVRRLLAALESEALRASAIVALGYTGRAAAVEACVPHLRDEKLARIAGEAVSAISGLEIEGAYRRDEPEEELPTLEGDDLDVDLVPGPEAILPLPEPEAVERWWKEAKGRFVPGGRYLWGKSCNAETPLALLTTGPMHRRQAIALELAVRSGGEYDLETLTWARDQAACAERLALQRPDLTRALEPLLER